MAVNKINKISNEGKIILMILDLETNKKFTTLQLDFLSEVAA